MAQKAPCSAIRNQQLPSFCFLIQQGIIVTMGVMETMCESDGRLEVLQARLEHGGDINDLYDGVRPLR